MKMRRKMWKERKRNGRVMMRGVRGKRKREGNQRTSRLMRMTTCCSRIITSLASVGQSLETSLSA
uniref:Uncharacterized protein n=1 Tax=Arundo donax TaxID=35708 RepID=A0A0A9DVB3_ARUDO